MVINKKEDRAGSPLIVIRCKPVGDTWTAGTRAGDSAGVVVVRGGGDMRPVVSRGTAGKPVEAIEDGGTRIIHVMRRGTMYRSLDGLRWTQETDPDVPELPEGGVRITMDE